MTEDNHWVIAIDNIFYSRDVNVVPICVFKVPDSLRASKPEVYIPQVVGLGPLHHTRLQLESMYMYKLGVARNIHNVLVTRNGGIEFEKFIKKLKKKLVPSARACYQMCLNDSDFAIAYVMAIDALFLFVLLCHHGIDKDTLTSSAILRSLVDTAGTRLAQDGILRDTMMLENQIPMRVLKNILLMECSMPKPNPVASEKKQKSPIVEKYLPKMLLGYCKALSPFQVLENYPTSTALKHAHLLDLLYHMIMLTEPPKETAPEEEEEKEEEEEEEEKEEEEEEEEGSLAAQRRTMFDFVTTVSGLLQGFLDLPWSQLDPSPIKNNAPVEKEILIPTASKLSDVEVKFLCANHITAIGFDRDTISFKLPILKIDVDTEVIIRNLTAYEEMSKSESESLVLTRYFELMNGIIKTEKDVKVLKYHGILQSESMKDDEVVKIFSGTSKPVRLAKVHDLDKTITEVNNYYNGLLKVKARKFIKKCVLSLWNYRTIIAAILLLFLMALQTFSAIYGSSRKSDKSN